MAPSNHLTAILYFIAIVCSIPIITTGIWLASKPDNECVRLLSWPVLFGALVLVVTQAGFAGAYYYKETPPAFYLCVTAILIGLHLFVLIFAFIVTRPDGSYNVPGSAYQEYWLSGYSWWLRNHVVNENNWNKIRVCLADSGVCRKLTHNFLSSDQFFTAHISPLQSGCCKPPTACGYTYVNPTLWINPANPIADPDCHSWSNDQGQLCYNCDSRKAGLLGNLRKEWRESNTVLLITLVVLICVYLVGCSAFRNAQTEELLRRYKRGWI